MICANKQDGVWGKNQGLNSRSKQGERIVSKASRRKGAKSISPVIEEEEKILKMMEDREIPEGSGNRYRYILASENYLTAKTGWPKYLPVDTCETYEMNCEPETRYVETRRQKQSRFTTGLIKAGEKLLDGSPGGFLVKMVKTLAKPIYNWVINMDNDPVMEKFTNRILLET